MFKIVFRISESDIQHVASEFPHTAHAERLWWRQARLPFRLGGVHIAPTTSPFRHAAYLASWYASQPEIVGRVEPDACEAFGSPGPDVVCAVDFMHNLEVGGHRFLLPQELSGSALEGVRNLQNALTRRLQDAEYLKLLHFCRLEESLQEGTKNPGWRNGMRLIATRAYTSSVALSRGFLSRKAVVLAVRKRLGLPVVVPALGVCSHTGCGVTIDLGGRHLESCVHNGNKATIHNSVEKCLKSLTKGTRQPESLNLVSAAGVPLRLDLIEICNGSAERGVDVSITHPTINRTMYPSISVAVKDRFVGLSKREKVKVQKYKGVCKAAGILFRPLVLDEFAGIGKQSVDYLAEASGMKCPDDCESKGTVHEHGSFQAKKRFDSWLVRLSCAVHEGFAMVIAKGRNLHVRNSALAAAQGDSDTRAFQNAGLVTVHWIPARSYQASITKSGPCYAIIMSYDSYLWV